MSQLNSPDKKTVLITGASTGIGAACALHLDRLGFWVFAGVRKEHDAASLKARSSGRLLPVLLDVTDDTSIKNVQDLLSEQVGSHGLYGLVNNAGIAVAGPLEAVPIPDLRRQLEVNVIGQVAVIQAFLPLIRRARGRIINMGSIAGRGAMPLMGPYAASKFALEAITDALRLEVQQWGIQVSIIEPGAIATPIWEKSGKWAAELEANTTPELRELYREVVTGVRTVVERAAERAIPAEIVARVVEKALTAARPKTRYLVGTDAKLRAFLVKLLPDRLSDKMLTWALNLPR
ncbi:MAG: SDR family oxidoreductase [Nitrospira sp.]|nr:SDR family oxidoreductase [Nitrospira sp.]MCP9462917.1 SDR family oxidoreductase [Nitrospira sp.]MCP9474599.1 SDR family oxidoreductase [Nitrospira sp.]